MRITMCGTASGGNTRSAGSSILLEAASQRLLLDCGHSSVNGLVTALGPPRTTIDALLFSHLHFDHATGLPELLSRFAFEGRTWPRILGPRDSAAFARDALAVAKALWGNPGRPLPADPALEERGPGHEATVGEVLIRWAEVPHVPHLQCLATRLEWDGGVVVYSGDTTDAPEVMTPLSMGADVLIHECYSDAALERTVANLPEALQKVARETVVATHTRVETASRVARDAEVDTLVLTHLLEGEDASTLAERAAAIFKGRLFVAQDGIVVEA